MMNSWKFNSTANYFLKFAIAKALEIKPSEVYKVVKEIKATTIHLKDGRILELNQNQKECDYTNEGHRNWGKKGEDE